jgi:hypothetical protein
VTPLLTASGWLEGIVFPFAGKDLSAFTGRMGETGANDRIDEIRFRS